MALRKTFLTRVGRKITRTRALHATLVFLYFRSVRGDRDVNLPVPTYSTMSCGCRPPQQVARNNDLDNMHLLEAADEWPFLREVVGNAGDGDGDGEEGSKQEHLLCDALVGEPFYYRVSDTKLPSYVLHVLYYR